MAETKSKKLISIINKPLLDAARKNNPEKIKTTVLQLIDFYLREYNLGTWTFMNSNGTIDKVLPQRDGELQHPKAKDLYNEKFKLMEATYNVIIALQPTLTSEIGNRKKVLKKFYDTNVTNTQRYYTFDESDDSDLEDERLLSSDTTNSRKHRLLEQESRLTQHPEIWKRSKRTTEKKAGLVDKLPGAIASPDKLLEAIEAIQKSLIQNQQKRAELPPFDRDDGALEFVALYRGNNYMSDRWTNPARREHYYSDETFKPQFSEAALKKGLEADFYTQLTRDTNPYRQPKLMQELTTLSETIRTAYANLYPRGHIVKSTLSPSKVTPYVFNNHADWMQHEFSNGINRHLTNIKRRLTKRFWQQCFINPYNYALATGNRPYHSLKYAMGAKEYYPHSFPLRYNADGSLLNCHAGKIVIILIPKQIFLSQTYINRVVPKNYSGQTPIGLRILPELETTFIGAIPGEQVVYQQQLKFPTFNKRWENVKRIYTIKYGFNKTLYTQFQTLIKMTAVESPVRIAVLNLLKEWLCAFHEVSLLKTAEQQAASRGGRLVYVDHSDKSVNLPDKNPKTSGGGNAEQRNRVVLLERLRSEIGKEFEGENLPGDLIAYIETKLKEQRFLDTLRYGTDVLTNEDAIRLLTGWQQTFITARPTETIPIINPDNIYLPTIPYSDQHVDRLLKLYSQRISDCEVKPCILPCIEDSELSRPSIIIRLLSNYVAEVLGDKRKIFLIPINLSPTLVRDWQYNEANWLGIVIRFKLKWLQIRLHDPSNSQHNYVGELQHSSLAAPHQIIDLLQRIQIQAGIQTRLTYSPYQQASGVNSAPWLIDSLIQIAKNQVPRNTNTIATRDLRNAHYAQLNSS